MGPIDHHELDAILAAYAHLVEAPAAPDSGGLAGGPSAAFAGHGSVNEAVQAGIGGVMRPHYMALISERCEQVKTSLATGGATDSRDLWYLGNLTLATGCTDGDAYAHRLSQSHPGYKKADTDAELQRAREERARKSLGYPTCAKFNSYRRDVCPGCPHWGSIRSPLSLGLENFDMPVGYRRENGWLAYRMVEKSGDADWVPFIKCLAAQPRLIKLEEGFRLTYLHNLGHLVYFDQVTIPNEKAARQYFARQHISLTDYEAKWFGMFLVAWIKHLEEMMQVHDDIKPCTWTKAGFAVGSVLYQPDGSTRPIPCPDPIMAADFTPRGTVQAWTPGVNRLIDNRPDIAVIVAAGFAAPLVQLGHYGGGLIGSAWGASGTAKSTAAAAGQSVWTHWRGNHIKLRDTANAISDRLGKWHNMPQYLDELRMYDDEASQRVMEMLFSVSEGSDKLRLDRNASARKVQSWNSLCMITTNQDIMDTVIHMTGKTTDAGAVRLFAFPLETKYEGPTDNHLLGSFEDNRGTAGAIYAAWLARHADAVQAEYNSFEKSVVDALQPQASERYYVGFVTCILLGAVYAVRLNLVDFDLRALQEFLCRTFNTLRRERRAEIDTVQSSDEVLDRFMRAHQQETLVTDKMPTKYNVRFTPHAIRHPHSNAKSIEVHIAIDDKVMRVNRTTYIEWCRKNNIIWKTMRSYMETVWRAVEGQGIIGKSDRTAPPGPDRVRFIEFDLSRSELVYILDKLQKSSTLSPQPPPPRAT